MADSKRPVSAKEIEAAARDPRFIEAVNAPRYEFWRTDALCRDTDAESFFPSDSGPKTGQLRVCSVCPVRPNCLASALRAGDQFGIWGHTTEAERRPMLVAWARLAKRVVS